MAIEHILVSHHSTWEMYQVYPYLSLLVLLQGSVQHILSNLNRRMLIPNHMRILCKKNLSSLSVSPAYSFVSGFYITTMRARGGAVAWGTALQAGRSRVRLPMVSLKSFRPHYGPGVDSASNRIEYEEYFPGVKVRRADNLTTFMCRLSWNLGASTSWNPQSLSRPVIVLLYLYITTITKSFSKIFPLRQITIFLFQSPWRTCIPEPVPIHVSDTSYSRPAWTQSWLCEFLTPICLWSPVFTVFSSFVAISCSLIDFSPIITS